MMKGVNMHESTGPLGRCGRLDRPALLRPEEEGPSSQAVAAGRTKTLKLVLRVMGDCLFCKGLSLVGLL